MYDTCIVNTSHIAAMHKKVHAQYISFMVISIQIPICEQSG